MTTAEPTPTTTTPSCCGGRIKSLALGALVVLNAALVLLLVARHTPENRAQAAAGGVNPSDILAVPGSLPGFPNGVVFLVDNRTGLLTAISYDGPTNSVTWLNRPIDIARVAQAAGGNRR